MVLCDIFKVKMKIAYDNKDRVSMTGVYIFGIS